MDNKVFFQHPDLMRALCVHETVMQLMVNTLNKAQQQQQSANSAMAELISSQQGRRGSFIPSGTMDSLVEHTKVLFTPPPHPQLWLMGWVLVYILYSRKLTVEIFTVFTEIKVTWISTCYE